MGLTTSYLTSTKDLEAFFNAIVSAQAPEQFTIGFLQKLDFTSSAHRLFIAALKGLGFLTADGEPTQRYYDYLDQSRSRTILAEAIREAYSDLFAINRNAQEMDTEEVKNKLRTLTLGKKTDDVLAKMATTFTALCSLADWTTQPKQQADELKSEGAPEARKADSAVKKESNPHADGLAVHALAVPAGLHYNIQIHLPESRDIAVYDAIFRALREHLF